MTPVRRSWSIQPLILVVVDTRRRPWLRLRVSVCSEYRVPGSRSSTPPPARGYRLGRDDGEGDRRWHVLQLEPCSSPDHMDRYLLLVVGGGKWLLTGGAWRWEGVKRTDGWLRIY